MNDRELLELAARAAGMNIQRSRLDDPLHRDFLMNGEGLRNPGQCSFPWNPLTDDGDALRLAVKLRFEVQCYLGMASVIYDDGSPDGAYLQQNPEKGQSDEQATRRAIVRAAAEIGKSMGGGE
ncbi:hypothetical protein AO961_18785 [Pseudomonas aeruginosa]|uniref:hypothetical protein n=1 Tax=Pseudomonas aeruginosa TaxID=287 RepID=UPI00071BEE2F|nr:hypothetical protein [Pseudomonas aeruginosa]KSG74358.1 hypothetical protein AO961_18785 [Pseudomonas aeruginosa]